ncbi:MAG: diguanylate cyclase, partial [Planctomycetes bacterium]|nr:diguanylate cyclase [Planctomycetota bacterium]
MTNAPPTDERRVLVIDDTESIHSDFRKILGASHGSGDSLAAAKTALFGDAVSECAPRCSFSITSAMQGQQGVQLAADARGGNRPFHVAFVDMRMPPGWDGITTIRRLWEADSELQVVISTAYSDHDLEHLPEDLKPEGRLLVLKKPFDPAEVLHLAATLSAKWRAEREAAAKMENLERMVQERIADIEFASLHDRLTGLPNRTLLNDRISMCIERHSRNPECKFAILFLDFDRFKLINDSMGHEVGDLLLIEIANRLRASIRTADTVAQDTIAARHGGDEFIVLLQDLREERDAARVAQRVLDVLSEPYVLDGQRVFSTASIGIATSDRGYQSPADMIRDADTAMYRAKAAGRARYVMFDSHMHAEVVRRLSLESSLRQAIRSDSIDLHYQPLLQLSNGDLNGFEALVRFRHPERGPVPAAEIIAIAEETGLIQPLSMCVFRKACAQLREWRDRYPAMQNLVMSINFSRKQLIERLKPELLVVCDYGQILSADVLSLAPLGGINLHASLLPKYRGAAPIQWALLQGETETGVSVIHLTPRLDGGPILAVRSTAIGPEETHPELEQRLVVQVDR